ncbi:FAD/NAD(P)-binding protein [Ancylobacter defluvii]|uniref:FAD-dependent urate hydroxylase HpyO/Asp monooxygenase CreE-like FAD/NAD(P)-binding domain-containing protein n=1 Tax=Ancylobacter defluvii TaxID=1282440 RepID=A0A9W6JV87_9HYPH|nr:FAD/NAD(P)-binding protein [Ancylobacter defluvii]MBS7588622.1 FAD/NAD(P)-binding protein [Ancylobacter defluvii]GLK83902.1 hypothetical protein GCM10017653_19720 [Ancylobacter defluvii]
MTLPDPHSIAIVGGGFAGAVTALRLIASSTGRLDLTVVEPAARLGRGIAYATSEPDHVVNGLAGGFALHENQPERHFLDWLSAEAEAGRWAPPAGDIAQASPPRALYGAYLERELAEAVRRAGGRVRFTHRRDRVVDVDGHTLTLASGAALAAGRVVLATGLHRREPALAVGLLGHPAYVSDIFAADAFAGVEAAADVLLLGSGLSMLDAVVSLEKRGFRGRYTVVSRRGLLVAPRREVAPWPGTPQAGELPRDARSVLRWIRCERRAVAAAGATGRACRRCSASMRRRSGPGSPIASGPGWLAACCPIGTSPCTGARRPPTRSSPGRRPRAGCAIWPAPSPGSSRATPVCAPVCAPSCVPRAAARRFTSTPIGW